MISEPTLPDILLVVAAFFCRSGALVCLLLCYQFFRRATGPLVPAFRYLFGCFSFLLLWVWVGSLAELIGYMDGGAYLIERSGKFIFFPNLVVFIALVRLLAKLHANRRENEGHYHDAHR